MEEKLTLHVNLSPLLQVSLNYRVSECTKGELKMKHLNLAQFLLIKAMLRKYKVPSTPKR